MKMITHKKQQAIWNKEHKKPYVLLQMDSSEPSSGVVNFINWLKEKNESPRAKSPRFLSENASFNWLHPWIKNPRFSPSENKVENLKAIELGCGKGRNVIWLASQGVDALGFDFSKAAIKEAKKRAKGSGAKFLVHDATKPWPFKSETFDIIIDCFATTDIESEKGRNFAANEMVRLLRVGGYLLAYLLSTDDEFHKEMIKISPAKEKNAFIHPTTGKFEKTFDRQELLSLYGDLELVEEERIEKTTEFFGKEYKCKHHWMIFQKVV